MRRPLIAALLFAVSLAPAALAGEGPPKPLVQYVDLMPVALPLTDSGRLRNYVFVSVRLILRPGVPPETVRAKEPYFRDALVRAGHRHPFSVPGDLTRIDEAQLRSTMLQQAAAIAGPGVITSVVLTRPPTPQRRTGLAPVRPHP